MDDLRPEDTDDRAEVVFSLRGVTRVYRSDATEVHALRGIDLDVRRGEFVVILGASGSGKSTLLNILGGLETVTAGSVRYRDHDLSRASDAERTQFRREHVGFVFQFYNLIPSLTAAENVALVTDIADAPMDPVRALDLVGLGERADDFPARLSGGEQQRVAIARAIAKQPDVLLCDEPTGALDINTGRKVLEVLAQINDAQGTTILVITHNAAISRMSDRVLQLSSGRIVAEHRNDQREPASALDW